MYPLFEGSGAPSLALKKLFDDYMHATVEDFQLFKASTNHSYQNQKRFRDISKKSGMEYGYPLFLKVVWHRHWR